MNANPLTRLALMCALTVGLMAPATGTAQSPDYRYPPGYQAPPQYVPPPAYPPQQQPYYSNELVPPHEFLPLFGKRFGEMFRRLFYGDDPLVQDYQQQPGGRNLDTGPPSYGSHYGVPGTTRPPDFDEPDPLRYGSAPRFQQGPGYQQAPRYQEPPRYREQPQYEQPGYGQVPSAQGNRTPQYQTPPTYTPPAPPKKGFSAAPSNRLPESSASKSGTGSSSTKKGTTQSSPPRNYTPPSVTRTPGKTQSGPPASKPSGSATADQGFGSSKKGATSYPDSPPSSSKGKSGADTASGTTAGNGAFLKGKRTSKPGRVTSPYPPYQELDVTGLTSGSLALDPTTQKVFEVP